MHPWKDLQTRLPTAGEVHQWWKAFPYGNVGCVLGQASGVVRVDVDGAEGEAVLAQWSGGDLPATWIFRSSVAGRGLLYAWPRTLPCKSTTQARPGDHNELRLMGNGSQTVLPPSRHTSGRLYSWEPGYSPDDLPLTPAPPWLVERLRGESTNQPAATLDAQADAPSCAHVMRALAYIPNDNADYDTWLAIGMALHSTGTSWARSLWDTWSSVSAKYNEGKQHKSWQSFARDGKVQIGTLFHLAKQHGYVPPRLIVHTEGAEARPVPDMIQPSESSPPRPVYQRRQEARIARYKQQLYADPFFGAAARRGKGIPAATVRYEETSHV